MNRIALAYSGDLDSSVAVQWLAETYRADVAAVIVDIGQGGGLEEIRDRALALGASRAHVIDARDAFARDFLFPSVAAGAAIPGGAPLGHALARMVIAKRLVEVASLEGATAVAHASSNTGVGGGSDLAMDVAIQALDPVVAIIALSRVWSFTTAQKIEYAQRRGIPVPRATRPENVHSSLWGRAFILDGVWQDVPDDVFVLTKTAERASDRAAHIEVEFERGVPVAANGVAMSPVELIASLDTIAGVHGVGRFDVVERRVAGGVVREAGEAPAAAVLAPAHLALQRLVTSRELDRLSSGLGEAYADVIRNGQWFSPAREAIDAFAARVQERVTGVIRVKLFKGQCQVVGRQSPFAVSDRDLAGAHTDTVGAGQE